MQKESALHSHFNHRMQESYTATWFSIPLALQFETLSSHQHWSLAHMPGPSLKAKHLAWRYGRGETWSGKKSKLSTVELDESLIHSIRLVIVTHYASKPTLYMMYFVVSTDALMLKI